MHTVRFDSENYLNACRVLAVREQHCAAAEFKALAYMLECNELGPIYSRAQILKTQNRIAEMAANARFHMRLD